MSRKLTIALAGNSDSTSVQIGITMGATLILTLVVLGGAGALLAYGWPFLTYPVTALTFERPAPGSGTVKNIAPRSGIPELSADCRFGPAANTKKWEQK